MAHQTVSRSRHQPASILKEAVFHHRALSRQGLLERFFAAMFNNLVYPQIWEDPVVDMDALQIRPGDHIVTIASGGCNAMSYLTGDPSRITAVDLNRAHLALLKLRIAAAQHLPSHGDFQQFFAGLSVRENTSRYDRHLARQLDRDTREYWSGRGLSGGRRIDLFAGNFYRTGVLGRFITAGHFAARLLGVNPADMMKQDCIDGQRRFFETRLSPLFDNVLLRWLMSSPVSLYGLGIPPAQYRELSEGRHMADVVRERLGKLTCDFPLEENYFARQAFGRSYVLEAKASLPPYLEERNWELIRSRASRIRPVHQPVADVLHAAPVKSVNKVVLLDAQDWMDDSQLNDLWLAIGHAAAPGARVIFRTAGRASPLEGRVAPAVLSRWRYVPDISERCHRKDRSAIYGGFHLYELLK